MSERNIQKILLKEWNTITKEKPQKYLWKIK